MNQPASEVPTRPLLESELNGGGLKGVGARIVAETFHRAMQESQFSIVRDSSF